MPNLDQGVQEPQVQPDGQVPTGDQELQWASGAPESPTRLVGLHNADGVCAEQKSTHGTCGRRRVLLILAR